MEIKFTITGQPPTVTAQQKGRSSAGVWYKPPKLKEAEDKYLWELKQHRPDKPLEGPLGLSATFRYQSKTKRKETWKTTRPDTDNMIKLLKDCMTKTGFWNDDAQICCEIVRKMWLSTGEPGISILVWTLEESP